MQESDASKENSSVKGNQNWRSGNFSAYPLYEKGETLLWREHWGCGWTNLLIKRWVGMGSTDSLSHLSRNREQGWTYTSRNPASWNWRKKRHAVGLLRFDRAGTVKLCYPLRKGKNVFFSMLPNDNNLSYHFFCFQHLASTALCISVAYIHLRPLLECRNTHSPCL